jgi:hypothetical protein
MIRMFLTHTYRRYAGTPNSCEISGHTGCVFPNFMPFAQEPFVVHNMALCVSPVVLPLPQCLDAVQTGLSQGMRRESRGELMREKVGIGLTIEITEGA